MIKKGVIFTLVLLICSILLFSFSSFLCVNTATSIPKTVLFYNDDGLEITIDEINNPLNSGGLMSAGSANFSAFLSSKKVDEQEITVGLISFGYDEIYDFEFLSGVFFEGNKTAQAIVCNGFDNVELGETINLSGTYYTVCGIMKEKNSFIFKDDLRDRPQILVNQAPKTVKELPVTSLTLATEDKNGLRIMQADDTALRLYGKMPVGEVQSLTEMAELIKQIPKIALLLGLLVFISFSIVYICKTVGKLYDKTISSNLKKALSLLSIFAILSICLVGFYVVMDKIQIPNLFLPQDNIFNFSHYLTEISNFKSSLSTSAGNCIYLQLAQFQVIIAIIGFIISILFFTAGLFSLRKTHNN